MATRGCSLVVWKSNGVCEIVARTNGFPKIAILGSSRWVW